MKKETFKIGITISEFGNLKKFYKTFAKGNRIIEVGQVEFEGTDEQHNSGIMTDTIICDPNNLENAVRNFVVKNGLEQECFSVRKEGSEKVILTEEGI